MTTFVVPSAKAWTLGERDVHVWRVDLAALTTSSQPLEGTLSDEERARAHRFLRPDDRRRYVAAHGTLRCLLGRYIGAEPDRLRFAATAAGKPRLIPETSQPAVRFNLSHSSELALVGLACSREIGVDVERIRPELATEEIAERFFAPGEAATLRALPKEAQAEAFFACWTRKEAYVKARGDGLTQGLDHFEVTLAPGEVPAIRSAGDDPEAANRWSVVSLTPAPGYLAAVVVEGRDLDLHCWHWPDCRAKAAAPAL
jgi:4'-phosphopantetheinyl transferase